MIPWPGMPLLAGVVAMLGDATERAYGQNGVALWSAFFRSFLSYGCEYAASQRLVLKMVAVVLFTEGNAPLPRPWAFTKLTASA